MQGAQHVAQLHGDLFAPLNALVEERYTVYFAGDPTKIQHWSQQQERASVTLQLWVPLTFLLAIVTTACLIESYFWVNVQSSSVELPGSAVGEDSGRSSGPQAQSYTPQAAPSLTTAGIAKPRRRRNRGRDKRSSAKYAAKAEAAAPATGTAPSSSTAAQSSALYGEARPQEELSRPVESWWSELGCESASMQASADGDVPPSSVAAGCWAAQAGTSQEAQGDEKASEASEARPEAAEDSEMDTHAHMTGGGSSGDGGASGASSPRSQSSFELLADGEEADD